MKVNAAFFFLNFWAKSSSTSFHSYMHKVMLKNILFLIVLNARC